MKKRSIILYWLLLLVPALALGTAASWLICREQARVNDEARISAIKGAWRIVGDIKISVTDVQELLMSRLLDIEREDWDATLLRWRITNPLVRNAFVWHPTSGLRLPRPMKQSDMADRLFAARYEGLFSGRVPWSTPAESAQPPVALPTSGEDAQIAQANLPVQEENDSPMQQLAQTQSSDQYIGTRMNLRKVTQQGKWSRPQKPGAQQEQVRTHGWIPWFHENQLHMLGWIRDSRDGTVYGIELEMMWLLSHIIAANMPRSTPDNVVYRLLDGSGRFFFQSGSAVIKDTDEPRHTLALTPCLPHWQVGLYFPGSGPASLSSHRLIILWGLLLTMFLIALIVGGVLLTREAHRNSLDARRKTSFVSNVSHELKTPLTSIRMYAELMSDGRVKEPKRISDYLGVIVSESQRLTRLVNNVLDFGRLEEDRKKYNVINLDASECVRSMVEAQRPRMQEAGMDIQQNIPTAPVTVRADRDALEQVILNLIDNAIKYAQDGGELHTALERSAVTCSIMIMDRGAGIATAERDRIFDKFHRVDDSLTSTKPGSGLGLSIGRRLMRDMGGDLTYRARDGGGSCFVISIPIAGDEHEER